MLKVNPDLYFKYLLELKASVLNENLLQLQNANTIYNLPDVVVSTNNEDLESLINCKNVLKYLGPPTTDQNLLKNYTTQCKNTCGGAGDLLFVENENDYVYDNKFVTVGVYCTVEPISCNHNTGYVIATINSQVCKSKYPRLFGGKSASEIIACNDEQYPNTGSTLWDFANNEKVDPITVLMTHEDELLPDGSYRFRCKYNETPNLNPFIAHPLDRFHPIVDKCNNTLYAASYQVHARVTDTGWECDCGNFNDTRVKHLDESDPKSICTSCFREVKDDIYTTPFICFKESSPYTMPQEYTPCIEYKNKGVFCSTTALKINTASDIKSQLFINTSMYGQIDPTKLETRYRIYKHL